MVLRIFQNEIVKQCEFALTSVNFINNSLSNLRNKNASSQLWYFVQNFLVSAANVSKLLWGSKEKISESRKELRDSLNVTDNSILKSRTFRNHFEHYDERVESWAASSERKNFADSNIGPKNMIVGLDPNDYLRNFDTDSLSITFKGDTYNIKPVVDELIKLLEIAKQEASKSHWE